MSTRATIQFIDSGDDDVFYVYRHHDGFPENIIPDIQFAIDNSRNRWSEPALSLLVSFFIGIHFDIKQRIQHYELTTFFHGDESYKYIVYWDKDKKLWQIKVI